MKNKIYKANSLIAKDINTYLSSNLNKSLLRFITCGSVDNGKSTLIGRLLYDSRLIFEDHLKQLEVDSKRFGTQGNNLDFALLVDGLASEREQGITIDVAYRFFATEKRKFIVADTPGHEQYTRNMVTGASTAELAIILVDARKGISSQTRRHSYLCYLLGIKKIVLAVNKMDLVDFNQAVFDEITTEYKEFLRSIGLNDFRPIPVSAFRGDNIAKRSDFTDWYNGPTLMSYLENVKIENDLGLLQNFCMPVQWVNRPNLDFRGFAGKVAGGKIKPGDEVRIIPSGQISSVDRIVTFDGDLDQATVGQSITLTLKDDVDCSRGQIITSSDSKFEIADQFEATIIWMDRETLIPGRSYYLKIGTKTILATISKPKYQVNINTMERIAAKTLHFNEIGVVNMTTDRSIPFTTYSQNPRLGGFILIDRLSNATVSAGLINFALRRSENIQWQTTDIGRTYRAKIKNQKPGLIWMTGLSGAGKSTIANLVEIKLARMHRHTFLLDGDNMRHGLNKDLGFTDADRIENIRRAGEVAKLMVEAGLIVIAAFISPFRIEREMVRSMMNPGEFLEVFIDTPLSVAESRDTKGLYAKARSGKLLNFTGIDSPYEAPHNPDIHIKTTMLSVEEAANQIVESSSILLK